MKWFMATNEESLKTWKFFRLIRLAVLSAKQNTNLDPHLLYEGGECAELDTLKSYGVKVFEVSLSFGDELTRWIKKNKLSQVHLNCRRGAFLRTEIPTVLARHGILDEFVFYTDCDVVFLKEPTLAGIRPEFMAAFGTKIGGRRWNPFRGFWHFQSGVLLMNTGRLRETHADFVEFVVNNGFDCKRPMDPFFQKNLYLSDQVAINLFFKNRLEQLPKILNWNPRDGVSVDVELVHFNGLKWTEWESFKNCELAEGRQRKFERFIGKELDSYGHYCEHAICLEKEIL